MKKGLIITLGIVGIALILERKKTSRRDKGDSISTNGLGLTSNTLRKIGSKKDYASLIAPLGSLENSNHHPDKGGSNSEFIEMASSLTKSLTCVN